MRTPTLGTVSYAPEPPPSDPKEWPRWQYEENLKIAAAITALSLGHVDTTYVAPPKPREGDYRLCDGVSWNPLGTGKQFVGYKAGAWVLLG